MAALRPLDLRFTERAKAHLQAIQEYIHERKPGAATRVGLRIRKADAKAARLAHESGW